jgi:hypothetical protein
MWDEYGGKLAAWSCSLMLLKHTRGQHTDLIKCPTYQRTCRMQTGHRHHPVHFYFFFFLLLVNQLVYVSALQPGYSSTTEQFLGVRTTSPFLYTANHHPQIVTQHIPISMTTWKGYPTYSTRRWKCPYIDTQPVQISRPHTDNSIFTPEQQICFSGEGPRSRRYGRTAALMLLVQPCDDYDNDCYVFVLSPSNGAKWKCNETDRGKPKYSGGKTCPSVTLSTTNPTWTGPVSNPGLRGGRPAANRLSHGRAQKNRLISFQMLPDRLWGPSTTCPMGHNLEVFPFG